MRKKLETSNVTRLVILVNLCSVWEERIEEEERVE